MNPIRTQASLLTLTVALACRPVASGGEVRDLGCTVPQSAALWRPSEGTDPAEATELRAPDGNAVLRFPCRMARVEQRAYWDFAAPLDLAGVSEVELWARAEGDPTAVVSATLYFQAGGGWYAASLGGHHGGWSRVVLRRDDFRTEGAPEGWGSVGRIRLSFWKGSEGEATIYLGSLRARLADVVVVRNTRAESEAGQFYQDTLELLADAGIRAAAIDDKEVEAGGLQGRKVAVYPHNPRISAKEVAALEAFVSQGGKLLVCYGLPVGVQKLLGVRNDGYLAREYPGQFSSMKRLAEAPQEYPETVKQESWNILKVRPGREDCRVVSVWHDAEGESTGYPAVLVGTNGGYISHVILRDDRGAKSDLLLTLLGNLCPSVWEEVLDDAWEGTEHLAEWRSLSEIRDNLLADARRAGREDPVETTLQRVVALRDAARKARDDGKPRDSLGHLAEARSALVEAFAVAQPKRDWEFRGVWCHSAYGVAGETWDESIRRLKQAGFNAIVPNMLWGGVADYRSAALPVRDRVAKEGDQIEQCLAACRRHGIELHVWKVNWNLGGAPDAFVRELRAKKRLQVSSDGEEARWLCPSHPDNFALERDSLLEVVRKYDVDGIHFDYIRYPDRSKCFCAGCRERFEKDSGQPVASWPRDVVEGGTRYREYQDFRRSRITRLVRAVAEEARRIRPEIRVSAAVFSSWPACREDVAQDWVLWAREGHLDFVCPMNYTSSVDGFRMRLRVQLDAVGGRIPVYSGIGASAPGLAVEQVIEQVRAARDLGADGFIVFNYSGTVATSQIPMLGLGVGSSPTQPPHQAPKLSWEVRQQGRELEGGTASSATPLEIRVSTERPRGSEKPYRSLTLRAAIETCDGEELEVIGQVEGGSPTLRGSARLPPGRYRLVARGSAALSKDGERSFTARGPFVEVRE